jgi:hypothetical protein
MNTLTPGNRRRRFVRAEYPLRNNICQPILEEHAQAMAAESRLGWRTPPFSRAALAGPCAPLRSRLRTRFFRAAHVVSGSEWDMLFHDNPMQKL